MQYFYFANSCAAFVAHPNQFNLEADVDLVRILPNSFPDTGSRFYFTLRSGFNNNGSETSISDPHGSKGGSGFIDYLNAALGLDSATDPGFAITLEVKLLHFSFTFSEFKLFFFYYQ